MSGRVERRKKRWRSRLYWNDEVRGAAEQRCAMGNDCQNREDKKYRQKKVEDYMLGFMIK